MLELLRGHEYSSEFEELMKLRDIAKKIFEVAAPQKYELYGGNCCRQMAYVCSSFLSKMVSEYEWKVYESVFECADTHEKYIHAYCLGLHTKQKNILVDVAFDNVIKNNYIVELDHDILPTSDKEEYNKRVEVPLEYFEDNHEFFTGLKGKQLLAAIEKVAEIIG